MLVYDCIAFWARHVNELCQNLTPDHTRYVIDTTLTARQQMVTNLFCMLHVVSHTLSDTAEQSVVAEQASPIAELKMNESNILQYNRLSMS